MARQVTATITFILHEDLNNAAEAGIQDMLAGFFLVDCLEACLEAEHVGVAQYKSVKVYALTVEEAEDV